MELDPINTLLRLGGHEFVVELARRLEEASDACRAVKPGVKASAKVTVTFDIERDANGPQNLVAVREKYKSVLPDTYVTKGQFFYVGSDGGLFDRDPTSPELPAMRAVESQEPVVRDAGQADAVRRAE